MKKAYKAEVSGISSEAQQPFRADNSISQNANATPGLESFDVPPVTHSSFSVEPFMLKLSGLHFSGDDLTVKRIFKDFLTKFKNCSASIPIAVGKIKFSEVFLSGQSPTTGRPPFIH